MAQQLAPGLVRAGGYAAAAVGEPMCAPAMSSGAPVAASSFAWCSLDPISGQLAPYAPKQAQLLEAASRAGRKEVVIMVQPTASEHGLIAVVRFHDPKPGHHTQRTLSGAGERCVCRVAGGPHSHRLADFGKGTTFEVQASAFARFARVAWVSVEPVHGILQPYSRENALAIEEAYHRKEERVQVKVALLAGGVLDVRIHFGRGGQRHVQSTDTGRRSVSRLAVDVVGPRGVSIPLYRRPADTSMDSLRYRLESDEDGLTALPQVGALDVPEANFTDECNLEVDTFSPVKQMEIAVSQFGFDIHILDRIADAMREEPMRLAAAVCYHEYQRDDKIDLHRLIDSILCEWERTGLLPTQDAGLVVQQHLGQNPEECAPAYPGVAPLSGRYSRAGQHNGRPRYRQDDGSGLIYFSGEGGGWRMHINDDTSNWCFGHRDAKAHGPADSAWVAAPGCFGLGQPPTIVSAGPGAMRLVKQDAEDFAHVVAGLFGATAGPEELDCTLTYVRGSGNVRAIMLKQVAAASLWRVLAT